MDGSTVLKDGTEIKSNYGCNLYTRAAGDRVGVQRTRAGELRIHVNGVDQGVAAHNLPDNVYAVVDVNGKCRQVTLLPSARGETGILLVHHNAQKCNMSYMCVLP